MVRRDIVMRMKELIKKVLGIKSRQIDPRQLLLSHLPKEGIGAEVGVWKGDFSARLVASTQPKKLHLIDPWVTQVTEEYDGAWYHSDQMTQEDMDAVHTSVCQRFESQISSGQVEVIRKPSVEAAADFEPGSLDWIYIDGDHRYDAVVADLEAWYPIVKTDGMIALDDFINTNTWYSDEVCRAVDTFVKDHPCRPVFCLRGQLVMRKLPA